MAYKNYQELQVELNDGIAVITFVKPSNERMKSEVQQIFKDMRWDPEVRVVVVTGTGERFWDSDASKQDRKVIAALNTPDFAAKTIENYRDVMWALIDFDKPLVAAVQGLALGSSLRLAMMADFVIASERATFCDHHIKGGIAAGDGGVLFWPLLTGMRMAKQYLLTGDQLDAKEAERIGLINKVVPHDQLMPEAMTLARRLAAGPTYAMRLTKQSLHQWYKVFAVNAFEFSAWAEMASMLSPEGKEGLAASAERREPKFH